MLALVRTPSGTTCQGVLQLEATFSEVKNKSGDTCFSLKKKKLLPFGGRHLQVAPEGVLTKESITKY